MPSRPASDRRRAARWAIIVLLAVGLFLALRRIQQAPAPTAEANTGRTSASEKSVAGKSASAPGVDAAELAAALSASREQAMAMLQQRLDQVGIRPNEALLTFKDEAAYRRFLDRAAAAGLTVIDQIDRLYAVRVGYEGLDGLLNDLMQNTSDYTEIAPNYLVSPPTVPLPQNRAAVIEVPVGNSLFSILGANGDRSTWGNNVKIAILDTGVAPDSTFGVGQLQFLDIGFGTAPGNGTEDGHGTAVAALIAGSSADAAGIAPAASLLSIRVTDASSLSDVFTISQALLAAVDAGARIVNISLGGYGTSSVLTGAIGQAVAQGVLVVASAGNDQAGQLTWPAADARVVSVGAVDALGQQVLFSNSGSQLRLTAPGYGVPTAWLDQQRITMDGTSASAPLVTGAVAALLSANPNLTSTQAEQLLEKYSSDAGTLGQDPNYGVGILNLGWALNRNNSAYGDTAISTLAYDSSTGNVDILVQNRGTQGVSGMSLDLVLGTAGRSVSVPYLAPGAAMVVRVPFGSGSAGTAGTVRIATQLNNPAGFVDQVPANNRSTNVLSLATGP